MTHYDMVYILGNLLMAFVIYKFMCVFYSDCKVRPVYVWLSYLCYFVLITCTHLFIRLPLAVMIANLVLLYLITFLYSGKLQKAILSVAIIYLTLMCIETTIVFLTGYLKLNLFMEFEYDSAFGIIVIRIVSYAFVLAINGFKNVKSEYPIPNVYWISLVIVPLGTILMLFTVFTSNSIAYSLVLISIVSAFSLNILTFYLYDQISNLISRKMDEKRTEERQKYYEHQLEMMKYTLANIKVLRHDLKNKLSPLYELATSGKTDELAKLLAELTDMCHFSKEYVASGNHNVDSIINYKLQDAKTKNITIEADILVPTELPIAMFDIADILGNLLDNAIEAVERISDRWINMKIRYTKGCLIIEISNSYDGLIQKDGNSFISHKQDKGNHGLGLKSIQTAAQRYDGAMKISHDEKKFKVKVLMYL
jgi:two-component system sensor histidine kinase AgrC